MTVRKASVHLDGITHKAGDVGIHEDGEHHPYRHHDDGQAAAALIAEQSVDQESYHCILPLNASVGFIFAIFFDGQ